MQALIATSRSITQDPFLDRENKRKYNQHVEKVETIQKSFPTIPQLKQTQKLATTLYKSKQKAKTFRDHEQKTQIKRQNRLLLQKIWKMNSNLHTDNNVMHLQHQSGSNWYYKKKQAEHIKEENKRLALNIIGTKNDVKDYKKKLQNEIKQYLQLRNNIRKFNYQSEKKKTKLQRTQSQKKGFRLTLKQTIQKFDEEPEKERAEQKKNQSKTKMSKQKSKSSLKNNIGIIKQKKQKSQKDQKQMDKNVQKSQIKEQIPN